MQNLYTAEPRKHVLLYHADDCMAPTPQREVDHADQGWIYSVSALKDLDPPVRIVDLSYRGVKDKDIKIKISSMCFHTIRRQTNRSAFAPSIPIAHKTYYCCTILNHTVPYCNILL